MRSTALAVLLAVFLPTLAACGSGSSKLPGGASEPPGGAAPGPETSPTMLIEGGSVWKLLDDGSDQGSAWRDPDFDAAAWRSGPSKLGYGDGDESTVVGFGPDPANKFATTYFRKEFEIADAAAVAGTLLELLADDGAVVYLNGVEIVRDNMPAGPIGYRTNATFAISGTTERIRASYTFDPSLLREGRNVLAVEVHQANVSSSDLSLDVELVVSTGAPVLVRRPYLQQATPTSVIVRWRTLRSSQSRVFYGTSPGALNRVVGSDEETTEHEVTLIGLSPETTYYYGVGTDAALSSGGDEAHHFRTPPPRGTRRPFRMWVIGDSGTADANARAVRDAYEALTGPSRTDVWLMLGDNALESGNDAQYQAAVFDMYPELLRTTPLWPAFGDRDGVSADSSGQSGPYFDIFSLPGSGEAGGQPSGTEAYYSFDFANVHFICLDSSLAASPGSPMLSWLASDLAQTSADFVVAYWHQPPYTKGSEDSDERASGPMFYMRTHVLSILDQARVDLVLCGHSHVYERSFPLRGHYGTADQLESGMTRNSGDGREDGSGAYVTSGTSGTVYVVLGCSGSTIGGPLDYPAMFSSLESLGSLVIDVDGLRLDARFLDETGAVRDYFTIRK